MKNNIAFFIGGMAIGFVTGYLFGKRKYQKIGDEDVKTTIEEFTKREKALKDSIKNGSFEAVVESAKSAVSDLKSALKERKPKSDDDPRELMNAYNTVYDQELGTCMSKIANIELIDEDDLGCYEDEHGIPYEVDRLYYCKDGILVDERNDIVKDIDGTIGEKCLKHFKDWDSVYVRNHDIGLDYEVLKSLLTYEEMKERG